MEKRENIPFEILGGEAMKEIIEIFSSGKFVEEPVFPGCHEHLGPLDSFERAIFTYASRISKVYSELRDEIEKADNGGSKKELHDQISITYRRIETTKNFMLFLIMDRMNLWDRDIYAIGINKGKNVIAIDFSVLQSEQSFSAKEINSIDDLPEDIKSSLINMVLGSKDFRPPISKFSEN